MNLTNDQWEMMETLVKEMHGKVGNFSVEVYSKKSKSWTVWFSEMFGTSQITFSFLEDDIVWFDGEGWRMGSVYELNYI